MNNLQLTKAPIAKGEMLIRKPPAEVFKAFINRRNHEAILVHPKHRPFGSRQAHYLDVGNVHVSVEVDVKEVDAGKRILIEWGTYGSMTQVEWVFTPYENNMTYVSITNSGFQGDGDKVVNDALD